MRLLLIFIVADAAAQPGDFTGSFVFPLDSDGIQYSTPANDPVAKLQRDLAAGRRSLAYDAKYGYLPAVLEALRVPRSSQMLVFSRTSFQFYRISPSNPRAIYFNDDVYVGPVPSGYKLNRFNCLGDSDKSSRLF